MAKKRTQSGVKTRASIRSSKTQPQASGWWIGIALVVIVAVVVFLINQVNSGAGKATLPADISVQEAYQKYQQDVFVLDVRTQLEWDEYIPGATLISLDELPNRLSEVPKDREIVVVCRSGPAGPGRGRSPRPLDH